MRSPKGLSSHGYHVMYSQLPLDYVNVAYNLILVYQQTFKKNSTHCNV
jgi:hypothetical protein